MNGRAAFPCATCGRTVAFISSAIIDKAAEMVPGAAAYALAARFLMRSSPDDALRKAAQAGAVRCCDCEAARIAAEAVPNATQR
jgi:hypothetical protein